MSKGSKRRPRKINIVEEQLRWELIKSTTTTERKQQIKHELNQMSLIRDTNDKTSHTQ